MSSGPPTIPTTSDPAGSSSTPRPTPLPSPARSATPASARCADPARSAWISRCTSSSTLPNTSTSSCDPRRSICSTLRSSPVRLHRPSPLRSSGRSEVPRVSGILKSPRSSTSKETNAPNGCGSHLSRDREGAVLAKQKLMPQTFWAKLKEPWAGYSRRDLFRQGGLLAAAQALGGSARQAVAAPLDLGADMYRSIGVRPVINARGTFTIITGSQTLPEVKRAMDQASRSFVNMDELMDGVSQRLAELTGAEWGIVTAGCCAAITHFTASAIACGNPERMQRLPSLAGLKSEAIVPAYSHNVYDHAIRMLGVKLVIVQDKAELEAAFNERTAMAYILGGPGDEGPLGTRVVAEAARRRNVPVLVDAAAEILTMKPNVHLERGAHAVAYSGGKCIRGPQAAGLLLGDKSLLQGAWVNSAPHHAFGRSVKVGKEEIMGMLAAVEMWVKRDHKAEWAQWEAWLDHIATSVKRVDGVTTKINQPSADLSNRTPELQIQWDGAKLGITGQEIGKIVLDTDPRIVVAGSGDYNARSCSTRIPAL